MNHTGISEEEIAYKGGEERTTAEDRGYHAGMKEREGSPGEPGWSRLQR